MSFARNFSRVLILSLAAALAAALLGACGGGDETTGAEAACTDAEEPAAKDVELRAPKEKSPTASAVVFETSCGSFTVALDPDTNPKTAASFQYLAEQGVYDDTSILRIAPGFVIQGGDPTGTQSGNAGYTITETPPAKLVYRNGIVAMAKSSAEPPGTSGSQFFVVTAPADAGLPPDYAVVGRISAGEDTLDRIEAVGTSAPTNDGPPTEPVVINSATAEE